MPTPISRGHLLESKVVPNFFLVRTKTVATSVLAAAVLSACSSGSDSAPSNRSAIASYCPYVTTPKAYSSPMTVTGSAKYQYRHDGNGVIPDGTNAVKLIPGSSVSSVSATVASNGVSQTITASCSGTCTPTAAAIALVSAIGTAINTFGAPLYNSGIKAVGQTEVGVYRSSGTGAVTIAPVTNTEPTNARPIRFAEVRATGPSGEIVQCAETDASGNFSMSLPNDGQSYTVSVLSRSSNSSNTAYIMNNPTDNVPYALNKTVQSTSGAALSFLAPASGNLEGGAFNILDQIANSQSYMRSQTATCTSTFAQCTPFTSAPLVFTYWSPGISPGIYYGISGPISFYLNGDRELYILGGENGNTTASDMDHFDNSVIVHEYGHFIEDQFGRPNSPGGSHNGNAIIDPRLAWGEGWANYFQAAVTGTPYYRDTKGYVNCGSGCSTTVAFNEPLESSAGSTQDNPSILGEGNFREFSVSRFLYAVTKINGFSEIWTVLNGSAGMRSVSDSYKSIGRFHVIQSTTTGRSPSAWATAQSNEKQRPNFTDYATRVSTASGCSPTSTAMTVERASGDNGSFAKADQLRNNDFYAYNHGGGTLSVGLEWSGTSAVDLDLYIYKPGYTYGDSSSSSMAAADETETNTLSGAASVSPNLPAGTYMINVMAFTGKLTTGSSRTINYQLKINGQLACPSAL